MFGGIFALSSAKNALSSSEFLQMLSFDSSFCVAKNDKTKSSKSSPMRSSG